MVVKTIVVRNLFSFEYDGSNPSLPTIKKSPSWKGIFLWLQKALSVTLKKAFVKNRSIEFMKKTWYNKYVVIIL